MMMMVMMMMMSVNLACLTWSVRCLGDEVLLQQTLFDAVVTAPLEAYWNALMLNDRWDLELDYRLETPETQVTGSIQIIELSWSAHTILKVKVLCCKYYSSKIV